VGIPGWLYEAYSPGGYTRVGYSLGMPLSVGYSRVCLSVWVSLSFLHNGGLFSFLHNGGLFPPARPVGYSLLLDL